jgi:hypothetical protein
MKIFRTFALLAVGASLSACAAVDAVSRDAPFESFQPEQVRPVSVPAELIEAQRATQASYQSPVRIENIAVQVPRSLKVSEANRYLPSGDIVWRGDPIGDRYEQVQAIFEEAMLQGVAVVDGPSAVDLLINVKRFHAITEKARYSTGGVHNIVFDFALADPETGALLVPWQEVRADLEAYGGDAAIRAEAAGQTQKVRIRDHLARVIVEELTQPGGHQNAELGLIQRLNKP